MFVLGFTFHWWKPHWFRYLQIRVLTTEMPLSSSCDGFCQFCLVLYSDRLQVFNKCWKFVLSPLYLLLDDMIDGLTTVGGKQLTRICTSSGSHIWKDTPNDIMRFKLGKPCMKLWLCTTLDAAFFKVVPSILKFGKCSHKWQFWLCINQTSFKVTFCLHSEDVQHGEN